METESSTSLFTQGLELAALGMGTVFVFFAVLVLATRLMSRVTSRWSSVPDSCQATGATGATGATKTKGTSSQPAAKASDAELAAVLAVSVTKHRARRKKVYA